MPTESPTNRECRAAKRALEWIRTSKAWTCYSSQSLHEATTDWSVLLDKHSRWQHHYMVQFAFILVHLSIVIATISIIGGNTNWYFSLSITDFTGCVHTPLPYMTSTCMAIATGRTLDYVTIATIASQTMYSWFSFLDVWEDQLPRQPLYVVFNVEYCDLLTMAARDVGWGLIIHSQDALIMTENWVI